MSAILNTIKEKYDKMVKYLGLRDYPMFEMTVSPSVPSTSATTRRGGRSTTTWSSVLVLGMTPYSKQLYDPLYQPLVLLFGVVALEEATGQSPLQLTVTPTTYSHHHTRRAWWMWPTIQLIYRTFHQIHTCTKYCYIFWPFDALCVQHYMVLFE